MFKIKKILLFIVYLFFLSCNVVIADDLIAPVYTKFSVKMVKPFEELYKGETIKFIINPRSLKNKKINWETLNLSESSKPFFVGTVKDVKVRPFERSDGTRSYLYSASFNIDKFVIDGKSYDVRGSFESEENFLTHNYNVVLNSEFKDSDFDGEFVDNIDKINTQLFEEMTTNSKININSKNITTNNTQQEEIKTKQVYTKHYFKAAKACVPTIKIGASTTDPYICFLRTLQEPSLYEAGFIDAEIPYAFACYYSLYYNYYKLGGVNLAVIYTSIPVAIMSNKHTIIDQELYNFLMYGKTNKNIK